jgi:redox-sensitive bicupin YhaK (pirin superfamily)
LKYDPLSGYHVLTFDWSYILSSLFDGKCEACSNCINDIDISFVPRTVDLGGFEVHRALPHKTRQMVGPFIFWDQMGPGRFEVGRGIDVRPHPHIGLSTVTYLFQGSMDHKDSLDNNIRIAPGDVNLMTAGKGIVHSERTGKDIRQREHQLAGIQSWLAQPCKDENGLPSFTHYSADTLPDFSDKGVSGRVIIGEMEGLISPVKTQWDTLYIDIKLNANCLFSLPNKTEELAIHLYSGKLEVDNSVFEAPNMLVIRPGNRISVRSVTDVHMLLLGGAAIDGPRYIWWNFVSSSLDTIKKAASDWQNGLFAYIPQDNKEHIPLPDLPFPPV